MKLFDFSNEVGRQLTLFDSNNTVYTPLVTQDNRVKVSCMHVAPQGMIGFHEATLDQLFLVVSGEGWVRGAEKIERRFKRVQPHFGRPGNGTNLAQRPA